MIHHPCGRTTRHRTAAIQAVHNATSRHGSRAKRPTRPAPAPADFPHPWWQSPGVTSRHDGVSCCCVSRRRAGVARTCTPGGVRCVRAAGVPSPTWWGLVRAWGNPAGGGVLIHHECGVGLCVHTPGVVCVTRTWCGVPCAVRARHWWVRSPRLVTMMRAAGPRTPCLPGAAPCPRDGAVRHPTHVTSQRTHPGTTQHTDAPCNGSSTPRNTPPTPRTRRAPNGGELLLCGLPPRAGPGGAGYRRAPLAAARETT